MFAFIIVVKVRVLLWRMCVFVYFVVAHTHAHTSNAHKLKHISNGESNAERHNESNPMYTNTQHTHTNT